MGGADDPLITTRDVAQRLGVSPRTIARWVADGVLVPAFTTVGGQFRFRWSEVEQQLRAQRQTDED